MNKFKSIGSLILVSVLMLLAACSKEDDETTETIDPVPEENTVRLQLPSSLIVMPASRAIDTQEENALTRLDVYVFDGSGVLEKVITDATVSSENCVDVPIRDNSQKSFYLIANPKGVSALDDVTSGQTMLEEFRELATDVALQPVTLPLMMSGYVENVDIRKSKHINISLIRRITKIDLQNDPLLSGFTIERVHLPGVTASVHIFDSATQEVTTEKQNVVFDYNSDQSVYFLSARGETTITLEGIRAGESYSSLMTFPAVDLQANIYHSLRVSEFGAYFGSKSVIFSGISPTDYRTSIPTSWSAADYSGLTWIGGNRYAAVHDKMDGFYLMELDVSPNGITTVSRSAFYGITTSRDCEGIVYHPTRGTLFISGEADQKILEYRLDGTKTGFELSVPVIFAKSNGTGNYGFEALAYNSTTGLFWTTTESTLPADGGPADNTRKYNFHRLQAFDESGKPAGQYAYKSDDLEKYTEEQYAFGISELTALPDGRLLVLEREFAPTVLFGKMNIYLVDPRGATDITSVTDISTLGSNSYLNKTLLASLNPGLVNYEGMCLGPVLADGTRSLLLLNDSQSRYEKWIFGIKVIELKEYTKMIKLSYE